MRVVELRLSVPQSCVVWYGETFKSVSKRLYPNVQFIPVVQSNGRVAIGIYPAHFGDAWVSDRNTTRDPLVYLMEIPDKP